ncbi:succinate dehydrogenase [ubiquinone] cytochrome b small subunit, mitochondrial [Diabrotica virgifera virgifera]|uniref:Succinate dehydrogenase [ubiquinone] cytochrome b small subunit n=1 Tax=Diabrotica virgifera virgifera TaxID=50390 RepID=A0A6P7G3U6_DIAVI|nr:succinate dehydrogenase [ubiquinone] cytochrome b small subunit, mitochondrial [Diabrotica virgifera virgifera]XP_050500225.1 succinate dehydrogenase [ubiquinone] cytochrome b small subunit, mitochondrial [Diabrotica virgifera virgifera]
MALAIILRNSTRIQASPNIFKTAIAINSRKSFTQLTTGANKNLNILPRINLASYVKRNMSADHSKLWPIERAVSIALLGITPLVFISPNTALNDIFAIATVAHFHWGLEACVVDYVRPIVVGPVLPKVTLALLYFLSISTLGGLLYYNHHSAGIGNAVRDFWKIKK